MRTALAGEQCLVKFSELETTKLSNSDDVTRFFSTALRMAMDCAAIALEDADLGFILSGIVGPVLWVMDGVKLVIDGLVAAAETAFDPSGYRITVTHPTRPGISDDDLRNITIPAGTCGNATSGWNQVAPIVLNNGEGEATTASGAFGGASITSSDVYGWTDVNGDGSPDAVMGVHCIGSTIAQCCAGRSSNMEFIAVLDFSSGRTPKLVGTSIMPGSSPLKGKTYGASRRCRLP